MAVDKKVCKGGLLNVQSVGNKTIEIRELIEQYNLDIFMLTETWLWGNIKDSVNIGIFKKRLKTYMFSEAYDLVRGVINDNYKL